MVVAAFGSMTIYLNIGSVLHTSISPFLAYLKQDYKHTIYRTLPFCF
jgi:hypothetical protein